MKTFSQFITEAKEIHDKEGLGSGTGLSHRGGSSKIGADRKLTAPEKKRVKAIGGGKTAPAKDYKTRKDAGSQRPKGRSSEREQQPTKERGSAALSAKAAQKKAYLERKKRQSAPKDEVSGKDKKVDLKREADKLLTKKKKPVNPNYKPQKASGYTAHERKKIMRAGRRLVRDIAQGKEKHISHYDPGVRKSK